MRSKILCQDFLLPGVSAVSVIKVDVAVPTGSVSTIAGPSSSSIIRIDSSGGSKIEKNTKFFESTNTQYKLNQGYINSMCEFKVNITVKIKVTKKLTNN
jgi:hypothetical protein